MKATLKGRYEVNKSTAAVATFALNAGDVRVKASMTDATFVRGLSLNGLALSLEKPGAFIFDYNVPTKDVRFQFMNSVRLMEKTVNLTYTHARGDNRTAIDGSMVLDPANKVSVSYTVGEPGACKVKYVYAHGELLRTVLEPCYDVSKNSWDFAITRKFEGGDSLKATYHTTTKNLGLEWNRNTKDRASFKISAAVDLAEPQKTPKLIAETSQKPNDHCRLDVLLTGDVTPPRTQTICGSHVDIMDGRIKRSLQQQFSRSNAFGANTSVIAVQVKLLLAAISSFPPSTYSSRPTSLLALLPVVVMGSPKEKTTTTTTSASSPAKALPSSSSKAPQETTPPTPPATAPVPPEWSASLQAYYGHGPAAMMPQAFYSPAPVAAAQPIVWGAQQVMPPYGSPIAYASFYPHGGFYAQPPTNAGMPYRTPETEGRPPETKDKRSSVKGTSKDGGSSPGKSGIATKGSSGAGDNASQSDDSATEGSSDTKEDDGQLKDHSPTRKRTYGNISAEGKLGGINDNFLFKFATRGCSFPLVGPGEASHPFSTAQYSGANAESSYSGKVRTAKKLPVSAPGRAALPAPQTNLNIGMDLWGSSHAGSDTKDERELRRERRKQSNRESARRSRLRKQQECEELARRVADLNSENNALKAELKNLKKLCGELEAENKSIMGELKQTHGPEYLSGLGVSIDPPELQAAGACS
ncbi:G-box-binding factor 1-like [Canna indica]|uniref:G-box-binding factor 1-like n=1 Tax=Canna indica TaxID=4628 RepID=A0AAQ3K463_9LILI|nr:G-box-binding factor 1-like [Canna indica]